MSADNPLANLLKDERGTVLPSTILFLFCICGLLSLLLFVEQTGILQMRTQQTADLVTKGARAAGKWVYVDSSGQEKQVLFATTREAEKQDASIIRGSREEAAILWELNEPSLRKSADEITVVHQKGEQKSLYRQGIYHLRLIVTGSISSFWEKIQVTLERVSQSGLR